MILRILLVAVLATLFATGAPAQEAEPLTVMTFNLRWAHPDPPDLWPDRRRVVREVIERWRPDIVGTQEGLYHQLRDMETDLRAYEWIGLGREGGTHGEFMAVFYRPERLDPLEYDHFWLSDTPSEIGSRSWGNNFPRMVTWVRFRDRFNNQEFVFVNTHFDHEVQHARERAAGLIAERARDWDADLPIILVGDFNAAAGDNRAYHLLTDAGFSDTWAAAGHAQEGLGTFHRFEGIDAARGEPRIDWILTRGPVQTLATEIVTHHRGSQYPSDHFPVAAELRLSPGNDPIAEPGTR